MKIIGVLFILLFFLEWLVKKLIAWVTEIVVNREVSGFKGRLHRELKRQVQICWKEQQKGQLTRFPLENKLSGIVYMQIPKCIFFSHEKVS